MVRFRGKKKYFRIVSETNSDHQIYGDGVRNRLFITTDFEVGGIYNEKRVKDVLKLTEILYPEKNWKLVEV